MPGSEKPDALAEIEEALTLARGRHGDKMLGHACEYCDALDRALSLLPRLREVVDRARACVASDRRPDERELVPLLDALAALGGPDGA